VLEWSLSKKMSELRRFLDTPAPRLLVISACTAKKAAGNLAKSSHLTAEDLDDPIRRTEKETQLVDYRLPAAQMYIGDGHAFVRKGVQALREQGYNVSHFILSAGYGLLNETDIVVPYNVTFSGASKAWIRERGQRLRLQGRLIEVASKHDRAILILGREYLKAIGLPLPTQVLPPTLAYIAPSFVKRIGNGVEIVSVGPVERREIGAYSSSAKEKRFLLDIQKALQIEENNGRR
jgi:hypothetical protein